MVPTKAAAEKWAKQLKLSAVLAMGKDAMPCQNFAVGQKAGYMET